jgi:hypothetical protein
VPFLRSVLRPYYANDSSIGKENTKQKTAPQENFMFGFFVKMEDDENILRILLFHSEMTNFQEVAVAISGSIIINRR